MISYDIMYIIYIYREREGGGEREEGGGGRREKMGGTGGVCVCVSLSLSLSLSLRAEESRRSKSPAFSGFRLEFRPKPSLLLEP